MATLTRTESLELRLEGCLNWQERYAAVVLDGTAPNRQIRKLATEQASTGIKKKTFLMDALESCLRQAGYMPRNPSDLEVALRNEDSNFMARAFTKLFCALISTRTLRWNSGGKFDYSAADYATVFSSSTVRSPAARLARGLQKYATVLVELVAALQDCDKHVFRTAVVAAPPTVPSDRKILLEIWRDWSDGRLPAEALDRLWARVSNCEFGKHCLDYDEFYYVTRESTSAHATPDDDTRVRATTKLALLNCAAEEPPTKRGGDPGTVQQWRSVARNWLCRGFRRCIYVWDGSQPHYAREGVVNLGKEVATVIEYVADIKSPAYAKVHLARHRSVLAALAGLMDRSMTKHCPDVVRMVMAGYSVDDIAKRFDWRANTLYALLLLVATERKGPRLQECWTNAAGTM